MKSRVHGNEPVIFRRLTLANSICRGGIGVKRLVPRLLLLSPNTIKPECPFEPKLQCTVRQPARPRIYPS
jgi:hypothetical protein